MKFELNLNEDDILKLKDAIEEAENNGCDQMSLTLKCDMDKKKNKCKIESAYIYGEVHEEYVSGNIW